MKTYTPADFDALLERWVFVLHLCALEPADSPRAAQLEARARRLANLRRAMKARLNG